MIYRSTRKEVQEYFDSPRLNQSELKLLKDCNLIDYAFKKMDRDPDAAEPIHFRQGGAVDILLTGTKEEFNELYHVSEQGKLPSDKIMLIMNSTFRKAFEYLTKELENEDGSPASMEVIKGALKEAKPEDFHGYIVTACDEAEYFMNRKPDSRVATSTKEGWAYFQSLVDALGKTVLTQDVYENIKAIVSSLKNSPRTAQYFNTKNFENNPNLDIYFQKIIYFTYEGIDCKAMLDILIVDKSNPAMVVFHPVDIKTTMEAAIDFPTASKRLRYDIQAAWYKIAVIHSELAVALAKANRAYGFSAFKFLVESTSSSKRKKALVFKMNKSLLEIGFKGKEAIRDAKGELIRQPVLGIEQLLKVYKYHKTKNDFTVEKILDDNPIEIPFGWEYSKYTY